MNKFITIPKAYELLNKTYDDFLMDMKVNDNFFYISELNQIQTLQKERKIFNTYTLTVPKLNELERALDYKYKVILNKDFLKNVTQDNIVINNPNVLYVDDFEVGHVKRKIGFKIILMNTRKKVYKGYFPVALLSLTPISFNIKRTEVLYSANIRLTTASSNMFFLYEYPMRLLKDVGVQKVEEAFKGRKVVYGYELMKAGFNILEINEAIIDYSYSFNPLALSNFVDMGVGEWLDLFDLTCPDKEREKKLIDTQRLLAMCRYASETYYQKKGAS